jgi:hypothetical protein
MVVTANPVVAYRQQTILWRSMLLYMWRPLHCLPGDLNKSGTLKKQIYDNRFVKLAEDLRVPLIIVDNTYV